MTDLIYNKNDVMRVIGRQCACEYIAIGYDDFKQVIAAHEAADPIDNDIFSIGIDFFVLGMIYGRKAERAERNRKPITPIKRK